MSNKAGVKKVKGAETAGLVPRLRFPEFRSKAAWEVKALADACSKICQGGTPDTSKPEYWNGEIQWLTPAEMGRRETPYVYRSVRGITVSGLKNCSSDLLPVDSVIISTRAPIGHLAINKSKMAINQGCKGLIPGSDTVGHFLYYILYGSKQALNDIGAGNTFKEITGSSLGRFKIALPEQKEQQKIADCLSSLDEAITLESQKLAALKVHKKGLMQQLFPAEGETVPKLRFPEFRGAGEWEAQSIGKTCEYYSGGTPATANKRFYGGRIPFIRSAEIDAYKTELFLTDEGLSNSSAKMVKKGDILIALYGANSGDVALSKIGGAINQAILCLRHTTSNAFVFQYLLHKKTWIISTYLQGGQGNLSGEIVKSITLYYPSAGEQQKIADCLSSLDDIITAHALKLDMLKTHKKGLMQQLFPTLDEKQE